VRQHRLPRLWLALTLGSLLACVAGVYWWERQLPQRIQAAASRGRLEDCLRYGEQLAALSWLPGGVALEQGHCRRQLALRQWQRQRWSEALRLQRQLVRSRSVRPGDEQRLNQWRQNLEDQAVAQFREGNLEAALQRLASLAEAGEPSGRLGEEFRQIWQRNRLQLERAERLSRQARWWEALDALNDIDHPWWRRRGMALQAEVIRGISSLRGAEREHDAHGALPHTVNSAALDQRVQRHLASGLEDGKAFDLACRELGGRVIEAGPDSACQR
jgi:hypothetical protein